MAPTEILARQHARTIAPLAEAAGLRIAILTGREKGREREDDPRRPRRRARSTSSSAPMRCSRTASPSATSALVVVDEQHRFGVHQRLALTAKGDAADMLVMTATPIPRTLVLTYYGDMDVSRLTEKPAGRQPIDTRVAPARPARRGGRRASATRDRPTAPRSTGSARWSRNRRSSTSAAAEERFAALAKALGAVVGLVHGRMKPAERDAAMARLPGRRRPRSSSPPR